MPIAEVRLAPSTYEEDIFEDTEHPSNSINLKKYQIEGLPDLRKKVAKSIEYPYCSIGLISGKKGINFFHGTGTLISNNFVLTCAHNCYENKN